MIFFPHLCGKAKPWFDIIRLQLSAARLAEVYNQLSIYFLFRTIHIQGKNNQSPDSLKSLHLYGEISQDTYAE